MARDAYGDRAIRILGVGPTQVVVNGRVIESDGKSEDAEHLLALDPFTLAVLRVHVEVLDRERESSGRTTKIAASRPESAFIPVPPAASDGHGVTEAPRGLLYHRYRLDQAGRIESATIVPPTSQNQAAIEADLRRVAAAGLHWPDEELTAACGRTIRNYDPCISCSAHFHKLQIDRR